MAWSILRNGTAYASKPASSKPALASSINIVAGRPAIGMVATAVVVVSSIGFAMVIGPYKKVG
jgi:hypothetical protein